MFDIVCNTWSCRVEKSYKKVAKSLTSFFQFVIKSLTTYFQLKFSFSLTNIFQLVAYHCKFVSTFLSGIYTFEGASLWHILSSFNSHPNITILCKLSLYKKLSFWSLLLYFSLLIVYTTNVPVETQTNMAAKSATIVSHTYQ